LLDYTNPIVHVINAGEQQYVFVLKQKSTDQVSFERIAVKTGHAENGFVEIVSFSEPKPTGQFVIKGAYDLWAQMMNTEEE